MFKSRNFLGQGMDKVIDISKVSYAMIVIKVFIGSRNHYLSDLSLCLAMWIR